MRNGKGQKPKTVKPNDPAEKKSGILSMPSQEALDLILDEPFPAELVQSFSPEDLYFLIHDIGLESSLPLLALASNEQWEYLTDLAGWEKDRMSIEATSKWLDLLVRADSVRCLNWLTGEKEDFLRLYFSKTLEIAIREHDQDPGDLGDDFITVDDVFYFRFVDYPFAGYSENADKEQIRMVVEKLLGMLADRDYRNYQNILVESTVVIPAESEEEAYRLRNVRLAERGFLAPEEACGIYQPLPSALLSKYDRPAVSKGFRRASPSDVSLTPFSLLKENDHFSRALSHIETDSLLYRLQAEFAHLCNQIITADRRTVTSRDELKAVVEKACGYLSIGLERSVGGKGGPDTDKAVSILQTRSLLDVFRIGYTLAFNLKSKAETWLKGSWLSTQGLPLSFWGEDLVGVLGGLLIKRPLYYDHDQSGSLYRDFLSQEDIEYCDRRLEQIMAIDNLLSLMGIAVESRHVHTMLTFKTVLLTLWVGDELGLDPGFSPLSIEQLRRFFTRLRQNKKKPYKLKPSMKAAFFNWLSRTSGSAYEIIKEHTGNMPADLLEEMENEYQDVAVNNLNKRYVHLFLVR